MVFVGWKVQPNSLMFLLQEETRKNVFRGKGGRCPPLWHNFFNQPEKGERNLITIAPENAGKCLKTLQINAKSP